MNGWNCDYYEVGNKIICEGYRPMGGLTIPYEKIRDYENKAAEIWSTAYSKGLTSDEEKNQIDSLLNELLEFAE